MFNKDTFRLIKKTSKRFTTILLIVFIGVAFMMGLLTTPTTMIESMDKYSDKTKLHDVQIYSSYGFDEDDVNVLSEIENVEEIFASKFFDCYCVNNRNKVINVSRIEELKRNLDLYVLTEGNYPKNKNEVLILDNSLTDSIYQIGDEIEIFFEDSNINEKIEITKFKIVGRVNSTNYSSKVLGTSIYKYLDLNIVIFADNDLFKQEYYTSVYLRYIESSSLKSYTDSYDKAMIDNLDELDYIALNQQNVLKNKIIEKANKEILENENILKDLINQTQIKLDNAKQELDDARTKIMLLETAIEAIDSPISKNISKLSKQKDTQISTLLNNQKRTNAIVKQYQKPYNQICVEVSAYSDIYVTIINSEIDVNTLNIIKKNYTNAITDLNKEIIDKNIQIEDNKKQLEYLEKNTEEYNELLKENIILELDVAKDITDLQSYQGYLDIINLLLNDQQSKDDVIKYIDNLYPNILDLKTEIDDINTSTIEAEANLTIINTELKAINSVDSYILKFKNEIAQYQQEYIDGMKQYNDAVNEFNTKVEDAQKQIEKAKDTLLTLPKSSWIILDRNSHYSCSLFKNNASQMRSIGIAIPFLFYIVAALVIMTTMIRLVDEQRGQIGIFIALGFSKKQIIYKYALYSFLACFIGFLIGIIVGPISFPVVIYNTWKLMYVLPDIIICYPLTNIIICFIAFTLLVVIETCIIVNNSLTETPASLMRPKAPKNAKKILLEKIPSVWNKLKFISKITLRNLFRYKARLFMTIIGIAGCTSLLVIGWGVKDSISDIIDIQFGEIFHYEYNINLENDSNISDIESILNKYKDTNYAEYMTYTSKVYLSSTDKSIYVQVINNKKMENLLNIYDYKTKEKLFIKNSGIIISKKFAEDNHIKVGDNIFIESINGTQDTVKVSAICEMYFQHYIFMSENYYRQTFNEEINYNAIAMNTESIDAINSKLKEFDNVESITDFENMTEQFKIMLEALDLIILMIIITAGSLAFVVLVNLINVNISERSREIATLKVLGFYNREIYSYIFKEIYILSFIGALLGLPLGVIEHHFIMNVISMEMVTFGNNIYFDSFLYSFLITLSFTFIVLQFTKRSLRKIEMIESLKSIE